MRRAAGSLVVLLLLSACIPFPQARAEVAFWAFGDAEEQAI
jgi:hypothetical protein